MPRLILIYLLFGLTNGSVFSQAKKIDSLRAVLAKHPRTDSVRVNRLYDLALAEGNLKWPPDKPAYIDSLATQSLNLANQLNYTYGQARALNLKATVALVSGNLPTYKTLNQKALLITQKNGDKAFVSKILMNLGMVEQGQLQEAYFKQALAAAQATHDPQLIYNTQVDIINLYRVKNYVQALKWALPLLAQVEKDTNTVHHYQLLLMVAQVYSSLHDQAQALHYLYQSQLIANKRQNKDQLAYSFIQMGNAYQENGQPDQAIRAYKRAKSYMKTSYGSWLSTITIHLAECYQQKGDYQRAFTYAHRALKMPANDDYVLDHYQALLVLGQIHFHRQQLDSAFFYSTKCLPLMKYFQRAGFLQFPRDVTGLLAQLYAKRGNMGKAFDYLSLSVAYKDSLNNEAITRKATAIQFDEQLNQQRTKIALLTKDKHLQLEEARHQRQLLYASLIVLALIGILLGLLYRNNRQKKRANAELQRQKQEIQTQRDQTQQAFADLKATQSQLIQKEKMASLGELTAGIAHEIQNPLNFVNNFSEVSTDLVDELSEGPLQHLPATEQAYVSELLEDLTQNLQKITHHGQRASNIVKGMLEHSRTSTGDVQSTNVNALADEYLRLAYHGQRAKDKDFTCELVTHFDPAIGNVPLMTQEIGRVLLNLFTNAFYAVRERQKQANADYQPTITVSTVKTRSGIEIRVSDNGIGMAQSVQDKIFQPFFTTKPSGEGTGLGLSLAYDIVTKGHGGSLRMESQPGEGTQFIIELPVSSLKVA